MSKLLRNLLEGKSACVVMTISSIWPCFRLVFLLFFFASDNSFERNFAITCWITDRCGGGNLLNHRAKRGEKVSKLSTTFHQFSEEFLDAKYLCHVGWKITRKKHADDVHDKNIHSFPVLSGKFNEFFMIFEVAKAMQRFSEMWKILCSLKSWWNYSIKVQ